MKLKNWWEKDIKEKITCPKLSKNIETDFLVIGGGIAGLHAALYLANLKKDVILLEKNFCGSSSSGKSSGFLTPASELDLAHMSRVYGLKNAKKIWEIPVKGVKEIVENVKKYKIECELEKQDCLYLGFGKSGKEDIEKEKAASKNMGVKFKYYDEKSLSSVISSKTYSNAVRTFDTYSINSLLYCIGIKKILLQKGVKIFEESEVLELSKNIAKTSLGSVKANKIIVCIDLPKKNLSKELSKKVYHALTFLTISEKLTDKQIKLIFPKEKLMCWDSRLVYSYFKITKEKRILLGGSYQLAIYSPKELKTKIFVNLNIKEFKSIFPMLKNIKFVAYWPGFIHISKDIMPIFDYDKKNNAYYVLGNPGLPWASFLGTFAAKNALNKENESEYKEYLSAGRKFFISDKIQGIIGKVPSFIINNLHTEYS